MNEKQAEITTEETKDATSEQTVVGVRFRSCGKIYTFKVNGIDLKPGNQVVVDSEMGLSIGRVVTPKHKVMAESEKIKKVVRLATERDFEKIEKNRSLEKEARAFCIEKAAQLNLDMKVIATETTLDRRRITFYFTADGRIDFRELVRDLASRFKTRIEMRQIGVRDEVKLLGGIGACGRQTCCSLFLTSFAPITIRMAKQQDLSINQSKLSGVCGRLMCCLSYEFRDRDEVVSDRQDEELITVTDETAEADLQTIDSETICAEELRQPICKECALLEVNIIEEIKTEQKEQEEKGRRGRRRRRRKKKHKGHHDKPALAKSADTGESGSIQSRDEARDSGKSLSKRKRFWKKKKKSSK